MRELQDDECYCPVPRCGAIIKWSDFPQCEQHKENFCARCRGRGKVVYSHNEADMPAVRERQCKACNGSGLVERTA